MKKMMLAAMAAMVIGSTGTAQQIADLIGAIQNDTGSAVAAMQEGREGRGGYGHRVSYTWRVCWDNENNNNEG